MITRPVSSLSLLANRRLDSKYFLSPGNVAFERLTVASAAGVELRPIGDLGDAWCPNRFKRAYAAEGEPGEPYLRPYDVFDYLPTAADYLSPARSNNLAGLRAPHGAILQTCSGRNLGPAVAVDEYLEAFILSHDLIRLQIEDEEDRHYILAFLNTPTGQALVRRDKTGSVIDHISVSHLVTTVIPWLNHDVRQFAAEHMQMAVRLRSEARVTLADAVEGLTSALPAIDRPRATRLGWGSSASTLGGRIDAAFHEPHLAALRADLTAAGGQPLDQVAEVSKPSGRYKTYYVGPDHGRPLMSGRQVLQYAPVNLRYISERSLDPTRYELARSWLVMQADGRAEERLGVPVMVEPSRNGWLASGHVGRIIPRPGVDPGWLFVAVATAQVQTQIKALACGSVVDALYEPDVRAVVLPPPGKVDGSAVVFAWEKFSKAAHAEQAAAAAIEAALDGFAGAGHAA